MTIALYGIRNCDTVKKARAWLDAQGLEHVFHDYKKEGADPERLARWADRLGWEALLNRRATTWRKLPEAAKEGLDGPRALALMVGNPSLIRRPAVEAGDALLIGFDAGAYARALGCG